MAEARSRVGGDPARRPVGQESPTIDDDDAGLGEHLPAICVPFDDDIGPA